jgi:hypothetical protein
LPALAGEIDLEVSGNLIEAAFWIAIGLAFLVTAFRRPPLIRNRCLFAAATFVLFGVSDLVEARTGAWWRPWWLLAWKATCIAAMLALLIDHRRRAAR